MKRSFTIKQRLYVSRSEQAEKALSNLRITPVEFVSSDLIITLADSENRTIENQFVEFQSNLECLTASLSENGVHGQIVFSIAVKAYEYIPEISLPGDLIGILGRLGASLDVDVINMVEPACDQSV